MLKTACLCLVIATTTPLWCQVEPAATGGDLDDTHMMTPPPVSNDAYPVVVGVESRSNYFDAGLVFSGSYVDNLLLGGASGSVSDEVYYFVPSVGLDRKTPRQGESLHYSSGFALYQNTSQLNGVTQDASADYRFHISPYATLQFSDRFQQNHSVYNQSNPFVAGGVSGTPGSSNTALIAPFANQINNSSSAGIDYQYGRNAMIGGTGSYSLYDYSESAKDQGLNNGRTTAAMAFYSRRIARSEYVGVVYQFSKFITHPIDTYTLTHSVFGFYTHYFTKSFSCSILGGPEHYAFWSPTSPKEEAWTPAVQGSLGWQTLRTNMAVSFSHIVAGTPGLIGTYHAENADINGRLALSPAWNVGVDGNYSSDKSVNRALFPGGHAISVGADVQHRILEQVYVAAGYGHFHESYSGIAAASSSPDSNRVYVSVGYGFHRPLGR